MRRVRGPCTKPAPPHALHANSCTLLRSTPSPLAHPSRPAQREARTLSAPAAAPQTFQRAAAAAMAPKKVEKGKVAAKQKVGRRGLAAAATSARALLGGRAGGPWRLRAAARRGRRCATRLSWQPQSFSVPRAEIVLTVARACTDAPAHWGCRPSRTRPLALRTRTSPSRFRSGCCGRCGVATRARARYGPG